MSISGSEFYCAIMCFPLVKFVFLVLSVDYVSAGQTVVYQEHLVFSPGSVTDEKVRGLYVGMDVFLGMDVFEHIQDLDAHLVHSLEGEAFTVVLQNLLEVIAKSIHHHETIFVLLKMIVG